jgi:hypothetical protein
MVTVPKYEDTYYGDPEPTKEYDWFSRLVRRKSLKRDQEAWRASKERWLQRASNELGISVESLRSMTPGSKIELPHKTHQISEVVGDRDLACHLREIIKLRPSLITKFNEFGFRGYYNFVVREVEREG